MDDIPSPADYSRNISANRFVADLCVALGISGMEHAHKVVITAQAGRPPSITVTWLVRLPVGEAPAHLVAAARRFVVVPAPDQSPESIDGN